VGLEKAQREINKYMDRRKSKGEEYRVENLVLLSTKDLKWQIKGRRLIEWFIGPYRVKGIISENAVDVRQRS